MITFTAGNIIGSQIFRPSDAPRYLDGMAGCAISLLLTMVFVLLWPLYYRMENKRRDKALVASVLYVEEQEYQRMLAG